MHFNSINMLSSKGVFKVRKLKIYSLIPMLLLGLLLNAQSAGFNNTFLILSLNGGGNTYYDLNAATGNLDFQNTNLGTFDVSSNSLVLKGAEHNVWKCAGCDLTSTTIHYRVYPTNGSPGNFSALSLPWTSGFNNGCGGQDQMWSAWGNNINLLSGLNSGSYYLEVYSSSSVTCAGGTVYASNGGANYKATFSVSSQALPVELLGFNGKCTDHQITLEWQTATEYNSDYFEVAKSRDGINWNQLKIAKSAGNSTQLLTYNVTDEQAADGNNYYRLTQVDIDGSQTVYDAINVRCGEEKKGYFSVYPNPSTGSFQVLLNDKNLVGPGILSVKDMQGSELLNRTIEVKPGINMYSITDLKLLAGTYYIQILSGERATDALKQVIR